MSFTPIDRIGAFRGKPKEWTLSKSKNGFPMFNIHVAATERYVDQPEEMAAFNLTEPGWVPWADYNQETVGHLCLFNAEKALLNYEQVQKALGWDGASLAALASGDWSNTTILFQMEENEYNGETSIRMNWIDAADASPTRGLQALDADGLKDLDSKFKGMMKAPAKAAPAKAGPAKPVAPVPPGKSPVPPGTAAKPAATPTSKMTAPAPAPKPSTPAPAAGASPSKAPPQKAVKAETAPFVATYKDGMEGRDAVWNAVSAKQGTASDDTMATLWFDACEKVAPGVLEDGITGAQWAKIAEEMTAKLAPATAAA